MWWYKVGDKYVSRARELVSWLPPCNMTVGEGADGVYSKLETDFCECANIHAMIDQGGDWGVRQARLLLGLWLCNPPSFLVRWYKRQYRDRVCDFVEMNTTLGKQEIAYQNLRRDGVSAVDVEELADMVEETRSQLGQKAMQVRRGNKLVVMQPDGHVTLVQFAD